MRLLELRQAVIDTIKARLPKLGECTAHAGRFDIDEIKIMAGKAPAIRVACLGLPQGQPLGDGRWGQEVKLAAFVLTNDKAGLPRDEAAINLVESLVKLIPGNRWGKTWVKPAIEGAADAVNLYSSKLQGQGIALWAVTWLQRIELGETAFPEGPILSAEAYAPEGGA